MKNRPELWQIIFHSVLCDSKDSPPFCSFSRLKELGSIDSHRVEMPNGTGNFRNFQISSPPEVDQNFQNKFPETFCSIRFRTAFRKFWSNGTRPIGGLQLVHTIDYIISFFMHGR